MASIKEELHQLIDGIENQAYLQDLFDSIAQLARQKGDVLDDLPADEMAKLDNALEQVRTGKTVPDAVVRERYAQWITN